MYAPLGLLLVPMLTGTSFEFALSSLMQNQGTLGLLVICPFAWLYYLFGGGKQKIASQTSSVGDAEVYRREESSADIEINKLKQQVSTLEKRLSEKEKKGTTFFGFIGKTLVFSLYVVIVLFTLGFLLVIFE